MRADLLETSAHNVLNHLKKSFQVPTGAMIGDKSIRHIMQWDALAYMIVNLALSMGGYVYGGFISSHFSGFLTSDIDLKFQSILMIEFFKDSLLSLLSFSFNVPLENFELYTVTRNTYSHSHSVVMGGFGAQSSESISVKVDITHERKLKGKSLFMPVTYGRQLCYNSNKGYHYKESNYSSHETQAYPVMKTIELLKQGRDKWLVICPPLPAPDGHEKYREYLKKRGNTLEEQGYTMVGSLSDIMSKMNL
jgi:hypothetical protein